MTCKTKLTLNKCDIATLTFACWLMASLIKSADWPPIYHKTARMFPQNDRDPSFNEFNDQTDSKQASNKPSRKHDRN